MKNLLFALCIALTALSSCRKFPVDPGNPAENVLAGTSWQLYSIEDRGGYRGVREFRPHTLNFLRSTVEGQAEQKAYTASYRAANGSIAFSDLVARGPESQHQSINDIYFSALRTAKSYKIEGDILRLQYDGGELSFERAGTEIKAEPVRIHNMDVIDIHQDPCRILSVEKLPNNLVEVTVEYSGGCAKHEFHLLAHNQLMPGNATDFAQVYLSHNANGDLCEAMVTEKLVFDMSPLIRLWKSEPNRNQRLAVHFNPLQQSGFIDYTE